MLVARSRSDGGFIGPLALQVFLRDLCTFSPSGCGCQGSVNQGAPDSGDPQFIVWIGGSGFEALVLEGPTGHPLLNHEKPPGSGSKPFVWRALIWGLGGFGRGGLGWGFEGVTASVRWRRFEAFLSASRGSRKVVVATNLAEASAGASAEQRGRPGSGLMWGGGLAGGEGMGGVCVC